MRRNPSRSRRGREAFDFLDVGHGTPLCATTRAALEQIAFDPSSAHHATTAAVMVEVGVAAAPGAGRIGAFEFLDWQPRQFSGFSILRFPTGAKLETFGQTVFAIRLFYVAAS